VDDATSRTLQRLRTRGAELLRLPAVCEARGLLVWGETGNHLPFEPKRFWSISDVPPAEVRGGHAYPSLHELLVCLRGSCRINLDDGEHRDEVVLDAPNVGLHVAPMTWSIQHGFTPDTVLLVLANEGYRPEERINDYARFLALASRRDRVEAERAEPEIPGSLLPAE
jgi:UDP-2-acetamido-3-amino-2,3-dideoxy-glucuronate N-acetyltransferase